MFRGFLIMGGTDDGIDTEEFPIPSSISREVNAIEVYWASSTGRCNTGLLEGA